MTSSDGRVHGQRFGSVTGLDHLLAGGAVLPEQLATDPEWPAEKKLAAAVIGSALMEVRGAQINRARSRRANEDLEWIFSDDTRQPFAFVTLCDVLSIDPEYLRGKVRRWIGEPQRPSSNDEAAHAA